MKRILVTGVAGLLGNHLSRHLLELNHEVSGIDNLSGGYKDLLPNHPRFNFFEGNLEDHKFTQSVIDEVRPDAVFHFAAYAAEGLSPFIRSFNYTNNLIATTNVVTGCIRGGSKLIFASSMAVYGDQQPPFTEEMLPRPIDPYGIAKYAAEMDVRTAGEQFGLRWTIVRPHNVIGRYQNVWDRYRNVAGIFIRRALNGEPILVYGDGLQTRAFSDVSYYMDPFVRLMDSSNDGQIFNIGADREVTLNHLAELVVEVAKKFGVSARVEHAEARHEVKNAFCDHSKAKELLQFEDRTDLESLVTDLFQWVQNQPKREVKSLEYEHTVGLYSYWK